MEAEVLPNISKTYMAPTIYHESWWLETASDGAHQEVTVSSGGLLLGRLPYLPLRMRGGTTALVMPPMTHVLGPVLSMEVAANDLTRSLRQLTITGDLIAQLPKASHIWFQLHRGATNTLAFEAAGFASSVDFTIEVAPDARDVLWRQMRDKTRNVIRRAEEKLSVVHWTDAAQFLDFYEDNLRAKGMPNKYERTACERVIKKCLAKRAGALLVAMDANGNPQAAIFTIWDCTSEYYHMSTRTADSMNGAISLLIWTAIQHAASSGLTFDTDGLNKSNMMLLTGFGGVVKPRYIVSRSSIAFEVARYIKGRVTRRK